MKFGEFLRLKRLEFETSLRNLSKTADIDVGYLSRIERGLNPPQKKEILNKLIDALKLDTEDAQKLKDLSAIGNRNIPNDIEIDAGNYESIPVLLRTINNKKLSSDQIHELAKRINEEY
jgi:transcriptional regulator with XRE-family HTH domain